MVAKAFKKAGVDLSGTLYLTAYPGEIGPEPAEEHQGPAYLGKEVGAGSEVCSLYVEINLTPVQSIADVDRSLKAAFRRADLGDISIDPIVVRHGFEADADKVEPCRQAFDLAHRAVRSL